MLLNIAELVLQIECTDERVQFELDAATRKFEIPHGATPDAIINVTLDELAEEFDGELLFDSQAVWKLYRHADGYRYRFDMPLTAPRPYTIAQFNADYSRGEVMLNRDYFAERPTYPLAYPLDEILVLNLLARGRGVELHSCGLTLEDGGGVVFAGQSGRGKTTTAQLWAEHSAANILSDDRIIIRKDSDELRMHGTPWHGDAQLSAAQSAPVRQIFFILHGAENRITPLTPAETVARLFSCGFPLFYSAESMNSTLEFYTEIARRVSCHQLEFVPDADAVKLVRDFVLQ